MKAFESLNIYIYGLNLGSKKLGYANATNCRFVLEADGTEVDEEYFPFSEKNTIFMLLKSDEKWENVQGIIIFLLVHIN